MNRESTRFFRLTPSYRHSQQHKWGNIQEVYKKAAKEKRTEEIKTVLQFEPGCPIMWAHVNGLIFCMLQGGVLDDYDDLLNGAGMLVTSCTKREVVTHALGVSTYEDRLSPDFFAKMAEWIRNTWIDDRFLTYDDVKGDDALYVQSVLELSGRMMSSRRAAKLLAA